MIRELIKDMAKYLPSVIVPAAMGVVAIPIYTRLFPPADFGNYALVIATVSILSNISIGWLGNSIIRFHPAYEVEGGLGRFYDTVLKMALVSVAVISVIFLLVLFLGQGYMSSSLNSLMRLGVLVFIVSACFQVLLRFLQAKRQVTWYTSFSIWQNVMRIGLGVALVVVWHLGIEGLFWGFILATALALPWLWKRAVGKGISVKKGISLPITSELAKYGFPLVGGFLTFWVLSLSDRYILELFRGSQEVGIYSASYAVAQDTIFMLSGLFILASGPISMHIWEKQGVKASQEFLTKLTRYYLLIVLPATVGLSVLAGPIIDLMAAPGYYPGYRIVPLVAAGAFLLGLSNRFWAPLTYYKKTNLIFVCSIFPTLLNIGLNFLLIPRYGYMAAAATTFVSFALDLLLKVIVSRRFLIWEFPFNPLAKMACASAVMGVAVYYIGNSLTPSVIINLPVAIIAGIIIYFVTFSLLRGLYSEEVEVLSSLIKRIIKSLGFR